MKSKHHESTVTHVNNKIQKCCINCQRGLKKNRRKFCSNKCKDKFHNWTNPMGYFKQLSGDKS